MEHKLQISYSPLPPKFAVVAEAPTLASSFSVLRERPVPIVLCECDMFPGTWRENSKPGLRSPPEGRSRCSWGGRERSGTAAEGIAEGVRCLECLNRRACYPAAVGKPKIVLAPMLERSDLPGPPLPGCRRARIFWRCAIQATIQLPCENQTAIIPTPGQTGARGIPILTGARLHA